VVKDLFSLAKTGHPTKDNRMILNAILWLVICQNTIDHAIVDGLGTLLDFDCHLEIYTIAPLIYIYLLSHVDFKNSNILGDKFKILS